MPHCNEIHPIGHEADRFRVLDEIRTGCEAMLHRQVRQCSGVRDRYRVIVEPVTFPPGRERLATSPPATASPTAAITMGTVPVACLAARVAGVPATIWACLRFTHDVPPWREMPLGAAAVQYG